MNFVDLYEAFLDDPVALDATITEDLTIDKGETVAPDQMRCQPNLYFKYARLAVIAEARAEAQKHLVRDELLPRARAAARDKITVKPTVQAIEDVAMTDPAYKDGVALQQELFEIANTLRSAERAMVQRHEMLRSLNSRQSLELK